MDNNVISLGSLCAAHRLDEKWLLVPSHRVGHQWIEALVRTGQPVVNLHPKTLTRLALDVAGPDLAARGLTLISPGVGALIVSNQPAVEIGEGQSLGTPPHNCE